MNPKSILRYSKFIFASLFQPETRHLFACDIQRNSMLQKHLPLNQLPAFTPEAKQYALASAIEWLLLAQKQSADAGFGSYQLTKGWSSSYIETTGYIIPTLLHFSSLYPDKELVQNALNAADWLVEVQKDSGGWAGECLSDQRAEVVFNTGQVIRGMLAAYKQTKDEKYRLAATKACDWLCRIQEEDGSWKKYAFMNEARVYDSYVDAPLLEMYKLTGKIEYKEAAVKNLTWILKKQSNNGWFSDCDNTIKNNDRPILHTIAYTIDGLLNCGILLNDNSLIKSAQMAADKLLQIFEKDKFLHGRFDSNWTGSEHLITTGCAQMSIVWMTLYKLTRQKSYAGSAFRLNDLLCFIQQQQVQRSENSYGAMSGSFPLWGRYEPYTYPNWATKYFADALMMESELRKIILRNT